MKALYCVLFLAAMFVAGCCLAAPIEERVPNLPNDQGKWYLTVIGDPNERTCSQILVWVDTNINLRQLKNQVHFRFISVGSPLYQHRFANNVSGIPTVRLQQPSGKVIYEGVGGRNLPMSAEGLVRVIAIAIAESQQSPDCPDGRCPLVRPRPRPEPQPTPAPPRDPEPQPINPAPIVITPTPIEPPAAPVDVEPADGGVPVLYIVLAAVGCVVVGLGLGLVRQWKNTYSI